MSDLINGLEEFFTPARAVAVMYLFNCAIQSLPAPKENGSQAFLFFYRFMHLLGGNLNLVNKAPKPEDK